MLNESPHHPNNEPARLQAIMAFAFPLLLWSVGCFYLRGELGRYSDDWAMGPVDPTTGGPNWSHPVFAQPYFWRPLLQIFLYSMFAALWNSMWIFHLANVLAHAGATFVLWRLLRNLCISPHAASAAALTFMVFPLNYEVIFWSTAMTTGLATGSSILLLLGVAKYAQRGLRSPDSTLAPAGSTRRDVTAALLLALFAFSIPCWYEQPAAAVLTIPLLYMATRRAEESRAVSLWRLSLLVGLCGVAILLYIVLLTFTAPVSARGSSASYIQASGLAERLPQFWENWKWFYRGGVGAAISGGLVFAWREVATPVGIASLGLVACAGGVWLAKWCSTPVSSRGSLSRSPSILAARELDHFKRKRYPWAFAFGASLLIASWLPIFVVRGQIIEARHNYFTLVGATLLAGLLIDLLLVATERFRWRGVTQCVTGAVAALGLWAMMLTLLGWQFAMASRTRKDLEQARMLVAAVPNPAPDTIFVTLEDNCRAADTGVFFFDAPLLSWVAASWSASPSLRHAYGRSDVSMTHRNFWVPPPLHEADGQGYTYIVPPNQSGTPDANSGKRFTWAQSIPFIIGADGKVTLVPNITLQRGSAQWQIFCQRAALPGQLPPAPTTSPTESSHYKLELK